MAAGHGRDKFIFRESLQTRTNTSEVQLSELTPIPKPRNAIKLRSFDSEPEIPSFQPRITKHARRALSGVQSGGTCGGADRTVGEKLPSAFTAITSIHPHCRYTTAPLRCLLRVKWAGPAAKRQLSFHRGCFNSQCQ